MEKIKIFLLHFKIGTITFSLQIEKDTDENDIEKASVSQQYVQDEQDSSNDDEK